MKITSLHVYPIKAIRGIPLQSATLTPQGIAHDRTFILLKVLESGQLRKMQLSSFPQCALFSQEIEPASAAAEGRDTIVVTYNVPADPLVPDHPLQHEALRVPLVPDTAGLEEVDINLHSSPTRALRMGSPYDTWFSACFGFDTVLVYIGSGRREVLGTFAPGSAERITQRAREQQNGWLPSLVTSYLPWSGSTSENASKDDDYWLTFSDCSPFLITSESSLHAVSTRLPASEPMQMGKFRPNIVLDGAGEDAWSEDFWAELRVGARPLALTANCVRCSSLNVDYDTGRQAEGESGTVLKKLMKDRRVDTGSRWSPVFGRYAFLPRQGGQAQTAFTVHVGDQVDVVRRNDDRTVWDWPSLGDIGKPSTVAASA